MIRDVDKVLIDRGTIARRVHEMGEEIAADIHHLLGEGADDSNQVVIVPVMTGAMVFTADLVRQMPIKLSFGLVAVSSYPGKSLTSKGAIIRSELPTNLAGKHVIIVDDILDSGQTLALVKRLIEEQSPASVRVCAFLWKRIDGYEPPIYADYVGFEIPDEFVVGYGLDYDGYYRNHPEIVTLKGEAL